MSGGLDSLLAAELAARAGFDVRAIRCDTGFDRPDYAARADLRDGRSPYEVLDVFDDVVRDVLPLLGERSDAKRSAAVWQARQVVLLERARRHATTDDVVLVTGDVVGQRRHGSTRDDFRRIDAAAGVTDRVERPLSAALFASAAASDDPRALAIHGRSRREQLALARSLGISGSPTSSGRSWRLDDTAFVRRLVDRLDHAEAEGPFDRHEAELLAVGRHFRLGFRARAIVGRDAAECATLARLGAGRRTCVATAGGALVLLLGHAGPEEERDAAGLAVRYGKGTTVVLTDAAGEERTDARASPETDLARWRI